MSNDWEWVPAPRAAEILGVSPGTLRNWRAKAQGPRFSRRGKFIWYRLADLDEWLGKHCCETIETIRTA